MFEQPKENIVVTSARKGTCATCGAKDVLVTSPPLPRHVDVKACDAQRMANIVERRRAALELQLRRNAEGRHSRLLLRGNE